MASSAVGCRTQARTCPLHESRAALVPRAFRDRSAITVPVSYYQLLQVSAGAGTNTIREAFERLVAAPTQAAYSPDTLFSRAVILKAGTELLCDHNSRRGYDQQRLHEVKVPQADVPGAVVLLQEAGEYEVAVQLATSWLEHSSKNAPEAADVATCLALAICDRAGSKLAAGCSSNNATVPSQIVRGCQDLEHALKLCQGHDVAPALQEHIGEALQEYVHLYALDLLALPLGTKDAAQRSHGLQLMCGVLQQSVPQDGQAAAKHMAQVETLLQQARIHLTSEEQLHMQAHFKSSPALASPQHAATVAYDSALANIAQGWAHARPHHIMLADQLLQEAEKVVGPSKQSPVALERACCAVLLGNNAAALNLLGLTQDSTTAPDPAVETFVLAHSPTGGDLQPGLHMLAKGWLEEALVGMRDLGPSSFGAPLEAAWFNKASVQLYLQVQRVSHGGSLLNLVHAASCLSDKLTGKLAQPPAADKPKAAGAMSQHGGDVQEGRDDMLDRLGHATKPVGRASRGGTQTASGLQGTRMHASAATSTPEAPEAMDEDSQDMSSAGTDSDWVNRRRSRAGRAQLAHKQGLLDGLLSHMPTNLLPQPKPSQQALEIAMSEMASSQVGLRRQLDQMEKAMWDGSSSLTQPQSPSTQFGAMLTQLVGSMVLGGAVLLGVARAAGLTLPVGLAVSGDMHGGARTAAVASVTNGWQQGKGCNAGQGRGMHANK